MRKTRRAAARAPAHEALLRFPVEGLRADEASLALRVVRTFLGRDRDGLRVPLICVVLLSAACFFNFFAELFVPAIPVLLLTSWTAVEGLAAATLLSRAWQRDGAGGAVCEDHF